MDISKHIENLSEIVRHKFNSKRKMSYLERRQYVTTQIKLYNQKHKTALKERFILKILCLDNQEEALSFYDCRQDQGDQLTFL